MSEAALTGLIVAALGESAAAAAGGPARLVTVSVDMIAPREEARIETRVTRLTRTLVFQEADAFGPDGERVASAACVHTLRA